MDANQTEFFQCLKYIYFRFQLKHRLNDPNNLMNDSWEDNYYLISHDWIEKWRNYVGFGYINEKMKEQRKEFISNNDYVWVQPIIKSSSNSQNIKLEPLKNREIYKVTQNNSYIIDPMKRFVLIDRDTFSWFLNQKDTHEKNIKSHPSVKVKFLFEKMIIKLDDNNYFISFKLEKGNYHELIFSVNQQNRKFLDSLLNDLSKYDINNWMQLNGYNLSIPFFKIAYQNTYIVIKNKTFLISNNKAKFNNVKPSLFKVGAVKNFQNNIINDPFLSTTLMKLYNVFTTQKKELNTTMLHKNPNFYNNYNSNNVNQFFPHKIGLQNIGQTCYMNATIQCLSNIQPLTEYFMSYNFMCLNPLSKPLSIFYFDLLRNLFFPSPEVKFSRYYAPYYFKQIIGKMNPLFQGFHPADSKDLLFFILETLHEELNLVNKNINMNMFNNFNILNLDSSNENSVFNLFMNDFNLKNNSIITKLFYGINESLLKCLGCNKITYSFQAYNLLIFPLLNVYNYKLKKKGFSDGKDINIYDAFESMNKEENFGGENMIFCNHCQNLCNAYHQQLIYTTPRILILVLNRGKNNMDYQGNFEFGSEIDLTNILVNKNNPFKKYFLIGVITHLGESGDSGHFIAYCRNRQRDFFLCYNDAAVCKLNKNDNAYGKNQSDNIYEKKTPYILFYQSIN